MAVKKVGEPKGPPILVWRSGPTHLGRPQVLFGECLEAGLATQNRPQIAQLAPCGAGLSSYGDFSRTTEARPRGWFWPQQTGPREGKVEPNA